MPPKHDWKVLRREFKLAIDGGNVETLKEWCEAKNLSYTTISRGFAELNELQDLIVRGKLKKIAPSAVNRLKIAMESDDDRVGIEASKAILDRAGFSPQAQLVSVQNNIQNNQAVIVPPMFADGNQSDVERLLKGDA
jgi:hypothetical protein